MSDTHIATSTAVGAGLPNASSVELAPGGNSSKVSPAPDSDPATFDAREAARHSVDQKEFVSMISKAVQHTHPPPLEFSFREFRRIQLFVC